MKILLDIKDNKVAFVLELLKNFKFVKAEPLSPYRADILGSMKQAVEEMNLIKEGKLKGIAAKDMLDEL